MILTIKGQYADAKAVYSSLENEAFKQIVEMCDSKASEGSRIRIMPDVHAGKGCPIGTTMTIRNKVVPSWVGYDIGCGMYTVCLGKKEIDLKRVDEICHQIPSGFNVWEYQIAPFDFKELRCYDQLKNIEYLERSLGTLGGGNHFIEIDKGSDGNQYLVIHSGSRNLGKQVAEIYMKKAEEETKHVGYYKDATDATGALVKRFWVSKFDFEAQKNEIIRSLKEQGRQKEISTELKKLSEKRKAMTPSNPSLLPVTGKNFDDYMHDIFICQKFAKLNREYIAKRIIENASLEPEYCFHTVHNYIDPEDMIMRKGAIAAKENHTVLIPINMRDGSILAKGKGNPDWNYSAPHGAGRIMSRKQARQHLSIYEFSKQMEGVYTTSVNPNTLDEAPMAYRSLKDIIDLIGDTVEVIDVIKPIYNFKASD